MTTKLNDGRTHSRDHKRKRWIGGTGCALQVIYPVIGLLVITLRLIGVKFFIKCVKIARICHFWEKIKTFLRRVYSSPDFTPCSDFASKISEVFFGCDTPASVMPGREGTMPYRTHATTLSPMLLSSALNISRKFTRMAATRCINKLFRRKILMMRNCPLPRRITNNIFVF